MKPIRQEHQMGCAVACIAFILKISYPEALRLFRNGKVRAKTKANFYCKELVYILNNQGLFYKHKYIKKRLKNKIYQTGTIVFLKKSPKYPFGHYLVRSNGRWMDPWINFPNPNIKAGFGKRLPEKPIYAILAN